MNYSITRLITSLASDRHAQTACPEVQLSRDSVEKDVGRPCRIGGAFIPRMSGLDSKTNPSGGYLTQNTIPNAISQAIRAQSRVLSFGAQQLSARAGNLQLPVAESGTQSRWIVENPGTDASQTDPVFSARVLTPHALVTNCSYTRQLLQQATADIDLYVITDIGRAIAAEIDRVAIQGSGVNSEPIGILNVPAVPVVSIGANGGNPSADTLYTLEESVGLANFSPNGYLSTPSIRRRLRKTPLIASGFDPVWTDEDTVNGQPARVSTNVPSGLTKGAGSSLHAIIGGDWSQMVIATWDHEIVADQFTAKGRGVIQVSVYTSLDVVALRASAWALCLDAQP